MTSTRQVWASAFNERPAGRRQGNTIETSVTEIFYFLILTRTHFLLLYYNPTARFYYYLHYPLLPLLQTIRYTNNQASRKILLDTPSQHGLRPHTSVSFFVDDTIFTATGRKDKILQYISRVRERADGRRQLEQLLTTEGVRQGDGTRPGIYRGFYFAAIERRREQERLGLAAAQLRARLAARSLITTWSLQRRTSIQWPYRSSNPSPPSQLKNDLQRQGNHKTRT
jgi:hypothetical protein